MMSSLLSTISSSKEQEKKLDACSILRDHSLPPPSLLLSSSSVLSLPPADHNRCLLEVNTKLYTDASCIFRKGLSPLLSNISVLWAAPFSSTRGFWVCALHDRLPNSLLRLYVYNFSNRKLSFSSLGSSYILSKRFKILFAVISWRIVLMVDDEHVFHSFVSFRFTFDCYTYVIWCFQRLPENRQLRALIRRTNNDRINDKCLNKNF